MTVMAEWAYIMGIIEKLTSDSAPTRWDECPGCRAGIKHIHCHNPWQDEGGRG